MTRILAAAWLLASVGRAASADQPACGGFVGPVRLPLQGFPAGIASADFNGDGLPDVATIGSTTISVRLGDPVSGLGPLLTSAGPENPGLLVAGDFDGGGADLVTADVFGSMHFLHGNGDGTFAVPVSVGTFASSSLLAAADVDGDGRLDLIGVSGNLVVYLGHGDGTFDSPIATPINVYATSMALADLDADGKLDVVIGGSYEDRLVVLLGNGDGTFAAPVVLDSMNSWSALVLGDFDGDGEIDLVGMKSFQTLEFLQGNGDGTFGPPVPSPLVVFPASFVSADLDGDGILDLVGPLTDGQSTSGGGLQVLLGRGDGTFVAGDAYATGAGTPFAIAGDFNADGLADVAVVPNSMAEVWWMRGKGDGTLVATPVILLGAPSFLLRRATSTKTASRTSPSAATLRPRASPMSRWVSDGRRNNSRSSGSSPRTGFSNRPRPETSTNRAISTSLTSLSGMGRRGSRSSAGTGTERSDSKSCNPSRSRSRISLIRWSRAGSAPTSTSISCSRFGIKWRS